MTYETYIAMSPEDQQAFFETFDGPESFFNWYNGEKEKYEKEHAGDAVTGDSIDLGDYIEE